MIKYILIILICISCNTIKKMSGAELAALYSKQYTVANIIPDRGGYWIFLNQKKKRYKTFILELSDSLKVGNVLTLTTITLIEDDF